MSEEKSPEERAKTAIFNAASKINPMIQPGDIEYKPLIPTPESQIRAASLLAMAGGGVRNDESKIIQIIFKKPLGSDNMFALANAISNATGYHASTNSQDWVSFFGGFDKLTGIDNPLFRTQIAETTTPLERGKA